MRGFYVLFDPGGRMDQSRTLPMALYPSLIRSFHVISTQKVNDVIHPNRGWRHHVMVRHDDFHHFLSSRRDPNAIEFSS